MKILVTGGAGFIGSHLVPQLIDAGHKITVLDNLSTGVREYLPQDGFVFWQDDMCHEEMIQRIAIEKFDAVVHLAAQTMVDASIHNPRHDADENITGLLNVLEGARLGGTRRILFASTAAVYGDVTEDALPIHENIARNPLSFYGLTKATGEDYLALYARHFGMEYLVLRFANVYGERQGDTGEGGVISIFLKRVAQNKPITIFGDGKQTRDFIYAGDIARGILAALETKQPNRICNLSTGIEISLNRLVSLLSDIAEHNIQPDYQAARVGDIFRSCLSRAAAGKYLGWIPQTDLSNGLLRVYRYIQEQAICK